jgi:hypothetical protein
MMSSLIIEIVMTVLTVVSAVWNGFLDVRSTHEVGFCLEVVLKKIELDVVGPLVFFVVFLIQRMYETWYILDGP